MTTEQDLPEVTPLSYILLFVAIMIFSGVLAQFEWLKPFDFGEMVGKFGAIGGTKGIFRGSGGAGARDGFLFALTLLPAIILALGIVRVVDGYGGLLAAERIIRPIFKPVLGIPGICGLAFITSLQTTDGSAAMTKELYEAGHISDSERTIFTTLMLSADGAIVNYFATASALFGAMGEIGLPVIVPFAVILINKALGANYMRLILKFSNRNNAGKQAA